MGESMDNLLKLLGDCTNHLTDDGKPFFMRENEEGEHYCKLIDSNSARDIPENYKGLCGCLDISEKVWAGPEVDGESGALFKSVICYAGCNYCKKQAAEQPSETQDTSA
ncbi:hypothetical protein JW707_02115 [Candidatus Woesearchaeota archaeon]|nr:hypothetical protein [Candidatus Woesearchaeota archaeon]